MKGEFIKKLIITLILLFFIFSSTAMATTFYLDYENGDDEGTGADWANAWKTITAGPTSVRTAPGDIIRIAKSPAPTSIGDGTWTNLSKTVTLATAGTAVIDLCETAWTGAGDTTVARTAVSTDGKEGTYSMKFTVDSSPQASILQAYYATGELDLSGYQKISFWIKNNGAIVADNWILNLCSDVAGADVVDSFLIPAIPSVNSWVPLTLTKDGGGNLGASIKSIAIYSGGTTTGMASKYIYVDDFIACTTNGLNLQSLISKNSAEQEGAEGWYGIQSINGTTVMLDDPTNTKGNAGQGYSTSGTSPDTVTTYKRETIKTVMVASGAVQEIQESGTSGNNIEYQGGYNTADTQQDGETFFDGRSGQGYGLSYSNKDYITLNHINFSRYYTAIYLTTGSNYNVFNITNISNVMYGLHISSSDYNTVTSLLNVNNSSVGIFLQSADQNIFTAIGNANNNGSRGMYLTTSMLNRVVTLTNASNNYSNGIYIFNICYGNTFNTISNINDNGSHGIEISSTVLNTVFNLISNANNNGTYGVYIQTTSYGNLIGTISTTGNTTGGIYAGCGDNYIHKATIAEGTKVATSFTAYQDEKLFINDLNGYSNIQCNYGNIVSQDATAGGTGKEWKMSPTNMIRGVHYPLILSIAKIAVVADKLVTVNAYFKKSHATDNEAILVCRGGQIAGVATNVTDTCPSDTNRNELEITFTPTEIGVVEIEAWTYWVANVADENVIIDDMTITQAE